MSYVCYYWQLSPQDPNSDPQVVVQWSASSSSSLGQSAQYLRSSIELAWRFECRQIHFKSEGSVIEKSWIREKWVPWYRICEQNTHPNSTHRRAQRVTTCTEKNDHISSREHAWLKSAQAQGCTHRCLKKNVIHVSYLIPCRTWHWPQAQALSLTSLTYLSHALSLTPKSFGARSIFTMRRSTAEWWINSNPISHGIQGGGSSWIQLAWSSSTIRRSPLNLGMLVLEIEQDHAQKIRCLAMIQIPKSNFGSNVTQRLAPFLRSRPSVILKSMEKRFRSLPRLETIPILGL